MVVRGKSSPGVKLTTHLHLMSVRNMWRYTSHSPICLYSMVFMPLLLLLLHRPSFEEAVIREVTNIRRVEVWLHSFLTSALDAGEWF